MTTPALTAETSGDSGNGAPEEPDSPTSEETAQNVTPVSALDNSGDEKIIDDVDERTKEAQDVMSGASPQATKAGSLFYPFICIAGIGVSLLLMPEIKRKRR